MVMDLEALLGQYEAGQMTRRELLGSLSAILVAGCVSPAPEARIGPAEQLNHVTLFVRDVDASRQFYQDLFGMPVLTYQTPGVNLRAGAGFIGLYPADSDEATRIHHLCLGLDGFDADTTLEKLLAQGLEASIRLRGDTKELYFTDPDGIVVQLQDVRYRGGEGPLGDRNPA